MLQADKKDPAYFFDYVTLQKKTAIFTFIDIEKEAERVPIEEMSSNSASSADGLPCLKDM